MLFRSPTVNVHATENTASRPMCTFNYSFNPLSVNINPSVTSVAQVVVEKQEIVVFGTGYRSDGIPEITDDTWGTTYTNPTYCMWRGWISENPPGFHPVGIRVIVKVTPNNGSAPFKVVKTFWANETRI